MIDQYDLLELFESEPKIIDEQICIYEYKKQDSHGFIFTMYLNYYDEFCSLTLEHKNLKTPIFDLRYNNVNNIEAKNDNLVINQTNKYQKIVIYFKPNYTLSFEEPIQ